MHLCACLPLPQLLSISYSLSVCVSPACWITKTVNWIELEKLPRKTETIFIKKWLGKWISKFILVQVLCKRRNYYLTSVINMLWLHFWGAVFLSMSIWLGGVQWKVQSLTSSTLIHCRKRLVIYMLLNPYSLLRCVYKKIRQSTTDVMHKNIQHTASQWIMVHFWSKSLWWCQLMEFIVCLCVINVPDSLCGPSFGVHITK